MADDKKVDLEGLLYETTAIDVIERDIQQVLNELSRDKSLDKFRLEYEKLYRALRKSHDSEKRLLKKCRELNAEIVGNAAKVQTALRLSEEDQATILALKRELEKSWKMLDSSHEKEICLKEQIQSMKGEISTLTELVEGGAVGAEDETVVALTQQRDELLAEREQQVQQLLSMREEIMQLQERLRQVQTEKLAVDGEVIGLREQMILKRAEVEREVKRKEKLEREIKDLKTIIDARQAELRDKQAAIQQGVEYMTKLEHMVKDAQHANDKMHKEMNGMQDKVQKLHHDLEEQMHINTQLLADSSQKQVELQNKDDEIAALKAETLRVSKLRDALQGKLHVVEGQRGEVEKQRDALKSEIAGLEREAELAAKHLELEKKKQEELLRERDVLSKQKTQSDNSSFAAAEATRMAQAHVRTLEMEIDAFKQEQEQQEQTIRRLEHEKSKAGAQITELKAQHAQAMQQLATRDQEISDLHKRINSAEHKVKQQQHVYDSIRTERNHTAKQLLDLQDDIAGMRRKFKAMHHHMEQLKEEIGLKDLGLVKQHFAAMRLEKERDDLTVTVQRLQQQLQDADGQTLAQRMENEKLANVVSQVEQEVQQLQRERDNVLLERDHLGALLQRRNQEATLLYEKIRVQTATLHQGRLQYKQRQNEIRLLKIKILELKREQHRLQVSLSNVDVLKREVHHLGRELLTERIKVRAMADELETPLNVHRWRKLEGSDPTLYELIVKVQTLQKRLIAKTEEVVEKDLLIKEKEKLYVALKAVLARQPGPEVTEQLAEYRAGMREKSKQLKVMGSELSMYSSQCSNMRLEMDRMHREMEALKEQYFALKRKTQKEGTSMNTKYAAATRVFAAATSAHWYAQPQQYSSPKASVLAHAAISTEPNGTAQAGVLSGMIPAVAAVKQYARQGSGGLVTAQAAGRTGPADPLVGPVVVQAPAIASRTSSRAARREQVNEAVIVQAIAEDGETGSRGLPDAVDMTSDAAPQDVGLLTEGISEAFEHAAISEPTEDVAAGVDAPDIQDNVIKEVASAEEAVGASADECHVAAQVMALPQASDAAASVDANSLDVASSD